MTESGDPILALEALRDGIATLHLNGSLAGLKTLGPSALLPAASWGSRRVGGV